MRGLDSSSQGEEEGGEHQSIDYRQLLLTEHCVTCLVGRRPQGETMRRRKRETEANLKQRKERESLRTVLKHSQWRGREREEEEELDVEEEDSA